MKCHNDPTRYYKGTEPSPKGRGYCAHCEPLDTEMEGQDGRVWKVIKNKNGTKRWGSPRGFLDDMKNNLLAPALIAPNVVSGFAASFRTGLFYVMSPSADWSKYRYRRNGIELDIDVERMDGVPFGRVTNNHGLKTSKITPDEIGYIEGEIEKTKDPWRRAAYYAISEYYHKHSPSIQ